MKYSIKSGVGLTVMTLTTAVFAGAAYAQDATTAAVSKDTAYIFNTLLFLIGGFLVMFMAAGFAMLEAGLVRSKNVSMQCLKNISLYSVAGIMYWLIGYNLMYTGVDGGFMGSISFNYVFDAVGSGADGSYSTASDWFFQMAFVAATASIVSGTVAERIKFWPFIIFILILTGIIYPISGSWKWGAGFLDAAGFNDFAGSTIVHSVGGWAALTGAIILGSRKGKYSADGKVMPMVGSNFLSPRWAHSFCGSAGSALNGASQLAMGTIGDVSDVSRIFANTNLAAAGGNGRGADCHADCLWQA